MNERLGAEVIRRLTSGLSLADLHLPTVENRVDLRGLSVADPSVVRKVASPTADVRAMAGLTEFRGLRLVGLDLSNSRLRSFRFFDTSIEDCRFDGSDCQDWRMWGTTITTTTFRGADLRHAALGGVQGAKRNFFRHVDFSKADLRGSAHFAAEMTDCRFSNTKLTKVDFQGTVFVDCVFEGKLDEVLFYRHAFRGEAFPPNEMKGVDLSRARLYFTEFRKLDMSDVRWPTDENHILVDNYRDALDRVLAVFRPRTDAASKRLVAALESERKWIGENQRTGVLSKAELIDIGGEAAASEVIALLR